MKPIDKIRLFIKRLARQKHLSNIIIPCWNTYEHLKFVLYINKNVKEQSYTAKPNPYQIYWVPPNKVKYGPKQSFDFITDTCKVLGGDWDTETESIRDGALYYFFNEWIKHNRELSQTDYYISKRDKISNNGWDRYNSIKQFEKSLDKYKIMYEEFKEGKYLLQSELNDKARMVGNGGETIFPSLTANTLLRHEIAVSIGRDGTLIRTDGRHRLALAALAELKEVPVRVVVRHREWQYLRDTIAQTIDQGLINGISTDEIRSYVRNNIKENLGRVPEGLNHPDLSVIFDQRL